MEISKIILGLFILILFFGCTTQNQNNNLTNTSDSNHTKSYSIEEVSLHSTTSDCWIIINNNVYNLSTYVSHPGGNDFKSFCGKDGTSAYDSIHGGRGHSSYADSLLNGFLLGELKTN